MLRQRPNVLSPHHSEQMSWRELVSDKVCVQLRKMFISHFRIFQSHLVLQVISIFVVPLEFFVHAIRTILAPADFGIVHLKICVL